MKNQPIEPQKNIQEAPKQKQIIAYNNNKNKSHKDLVHKSQQVHNTPKIAKVEKNKPQVMKNQPIEPQKNIQEAPKQK
jgi:hypothetical protein